MKEIKNLEDLFYDELQVLWSAENMLIEAMPKMIEKAKNEGLKNMLRAHFAETDQHKVALEMICKQLGIDPKGDFNPGIKGIIEEGDMVMSKDATDEGMDAALIAGAQKIEHYEISGYDPPLILLRCWVMKVLQKGYGLHWQKGARIQIQKLSLLAKNIINPRHSQREYYL